MSEVRLPLLRDAHVRHTPHTHPTANMAAQRVQAFQRDDGGEDRSKIGRQVAENDRTAAVSSLGFHLRTGAGTHTPAGGHPRELSEGLFLLHLAMLQC